MIVPRRGCSKMPCESCAVQFSVFKRKRSCSECERYYCSGCLRRGGGFMCSPCRTLSSRPLNRQAISHLKVRDLQCFLQRQNVSTWGCVEKGELVSLCVSHVNSTAYHRHGPRSGPFCSLKGITTNINEFLNSAFDLRNSPVPRPAPQSTNGSCVNLTHTHARSPEEAHRQSERFITNPGGEPPLEVPVPPPPAPARPAPAPPLDTADCFEIEDLDDAGWEFVTRPADPLPNDSTVLLEGASPVGEGAGPSLPGHAPAAPRPAPRTPRAPPAPPSPPAPRTPPPRASSELDLRPVGTEGEADTVSLQDEPVVDQPLGRTPESGSRVSLSALQSEEALDALSVRQLKQLLARNRVEYRGCLERSDLRARARALWREHVRYKGAIEQLPLEECCKICMAAPLECVLLECGHIAACAACSRQLADCPICRQYVVRAVRFFRS